MQELAWAVAAALCTALAGLLLIPCALLLLQVSMAQRRPTAVPQSRGRRPRLAVLMPAHNEAGGIAAAISAICAQLAPGDRLLVVADNCTDDTARVARVAGADVVERTDAQRRGKGHALDFGVRALERDPPEVVIIVDADCMVQHAALDVLSRACQVSARPNQALNLMVSPPGAGLTTRIAEFAWIVKNHARPLGFWRLGLPCQLMGTGMAFPWQVIQAAALASSHIVEDLHLGLVLAEAGMPPLFCPEARVISVFPGSSEGMLAQRTRWEHGHLNVAVSLGPRMLWRALSSGRFKMAAMVVDMCVPPLASLVLLLVGVLGVAAALALAGQMLPLLVITAAWGALGVAVMLAWHRFGRGIVSLRDLMSVPFYIAAKLPLYVRAVTRRQVEWVRTKRDDTPK